MGPWRLGVVAAFWALPCVCGVNPSAVHLWQRHVAGQGGVGAAADRRDHRGAERSLALLAGPGAVRPVCLRLRGGGKDKDMHNWVMKQATTQVGNEMLQAEVAKAYEHKIRMEMEKKLMQAAQQVERQVDKQIKHMEDMSSSELERLRDKRLRQAKIEQVRRKRWEAKGRGGYGHIAESEFFDVVKKHSRIVLHFARSATERCKILDKHLAILAPRHPETLFIKVDVEKCPFLCTRLNVKVLPCVKIIKGGEVRKTLTGFEEFGGHDEFRTSELMLCLARSRVIQPPPESGLPGIEDSDGNFSSEDAIELYDDGTR